MVRRLVKMVVKLILLGVVAGSALLLGARLFTALYARPRLHSAVEEVSPAKVAIVFGAGLWRDGSPTPVLRDRVASAVELYFAGKVQKLLMSGDNRFIYYNEPQAMYEYAVELGVPAEAIVLDYAGRRTYDTCYRAKEIFGLTEAVLVTQKYHQPRALFTCNYLGVKAEGYAADQRAYTRRSRLYWNLRELPATLASVWEVLVSRPLPVLGESEPIFPGD